MRLSVFTKIFLVFLLAVSPLYMLSVYLHTLGRNQIRHEIYMSTLNSVDLYISYVESRIEGVINTTVQLINNDDIAEIGRLDVLPADFNLFMSIERIQRELASLLRLFEYIEETYVLFPFSGIKIAHNGLLDMTEFDYARINDTSFYTGFPFVNCPLSGGVYLNFSSSFHMELYADPLPDEIRWLIVTKIDIDRIADDIQTFFSDDFDHISSIGDVHGITIMHHFDRDVLFYVYEEVISGLLDDTGMDTVLIGSRNILFAYRRSASLQSTFVLFTDEQHVFSILAMQPYWIWIISGTMAFLLVIFTVLTRRVVAIPMNRLIVAIKQGITGGFDNNNIKYESNEEFEYIYKQFNDMLKLHRKTIDKMYAQELMIKDTELKMLQYQINPHFLYNTFFTMYQMLQAESYDDLQEIMAGVGRYFNFITKSESFIPLSEEMDFCIDYIKIQTIRFSERIASEIENTPEDFRDVLIPRITLQPLLENCFKHGLVNKESDGLIRLCFVDSKDNIIICIEDNGEELSDSSLQNIQQGLSEEGDSKTLGIRNVHKRLRSYYGKGHGISVSRSTLGGLLVELRLPKG